MICLVNDVSRSLITLTGYGHSMRRAYQPAINAVSDLATVYQVVVDAMPRSMAAILDCDLRMVNPFHSSAGWPSGFQPADQFWR